jgi:phosphoserine phosphatase
MRVGGASALLVSGGFLSFAEPVAKLVGFDRVRANRLLFDGQQLSGRVQDPIIDGAAKRQALIATRDELGLRNADILAVGDGANDRLMIGEAGLGVAFRAKPALAEVADARLDHHGLDALLWAQGIRKQEWVRS